VISEYTVDITNPQPVDENDNITVSTFDNDSEVHDEAQPFILNMSKENFEQYFLYHLDSYYGKKEFVKFEDNIMKIDIGKGYGWPKSGIRTISPVIP
jgi:hypothetical protein